MGAYSINLHANTLTSELPYETLLDIFSFLFFFCSSRSHESYITYVSYNPSSKNNWYTV